MKRRIDFRLLKTFFRPSSVLSAVRCLVSCRQPLLLLYHYITKSPLPSESVSFGFRTPIGSIELAAFSPEDVVTLFIVFCRQEYTPSRQARVFADFGSNIGITAGYFLSRSEDNIVYCYEPNDINVERLRLNLKPFEGRYSLEAVCVGLENEMVPFGIETTGVYGAIGVEHEEGTTIRAQCRNVNDILLEILAKHPAIDFLKIDIEGLEQDVIKTIDIDLLSKIKQIEAETGELDHELPGFRREQSRWIVRYRREG